MTVRITSIALENIKSYQKIEVPLTLGTTAIRGHNGAGKSTLVEAIGFALFDSINYSQDQFVREGERYGVVTVSFISAEDDREYQAVRRCGSSPTWYHLRSRAPDASRRAENRRQRLPAPPSAHRGRDFSS